LRFFSTKVYRYPLVSAPSSISTALLRMDPTARADGAQKLVGAGIVSPNEARLREDLGPVQGGNEPIVQQQNWPLSVLAQRAPPEGSKLAFTLNRTDGSKERYYKVDPKLDAAA
jgi:hypothetical protein